MMHRSLRLSAFLAGLLVGGLSVLFAFDNPARTALAIGAWHLQAVPLWTLGLVPLVAGVAAGYLYHLPARMHHFGEHMKHRGLVHELRRENEELSRSLDRLLAMPNDDTAAKNVTPPADPPSQLALAESQPVLLQTVGIAAASPAAESGVNGLRNGHRPRPTERRPHERPPGAADAMKEAIAAAAAALPAEHPARAARALRASPRQVDPN